MEVEVAPTALDLAEECPVNTAFGGQGFLTEALGFTVLTDAGTEGLGSWGDEFGHGVVMPIRPDYLCPRAFISHVLVSSYSAAPCRHPKGWSSCA
jgi:hypothetical protein